MQTVFKRYEEKYLIAEAQKNALLADISGHIVADKHSEYIVQNLYFDTENWDVIRTSIDNPLYKEKMRLRCYGEHVQESRLFLELKKKYEKVVYKRRVALPGELLSDNNVQDIVEKKPSQISRELQYYMKTNSVYEKMYLSYKRCAFTSAEDKGVRITFDTDIRYRMYDLELRQHERGISVLEPDQTIMEIKMWGGMPPWLVKALGDNKIYPVTFSKCGACYTKHVIMQQKGDVA